ncbi:DUF5704 domain-containing protein [Paenibacillus sp. SC116]|uniref:DUF5704 domain-containing protein n=1 Tax=Paenibacillus sp. SC116 TaxID=2968986 RepID=UPI00215AF1C6|nr:DUF5704 domain-containing protein [Paenibacillus sp. SC116]MCR8845231.1 DUF5704 domain-containing protein [Paenibacillus sp. SC116]
MAKRIVSIAMVVSLLIAITNILGINMTVSAAVPSGYESIGNVTFYGGIGKVDSSKNHYIPLSKLHYTTVTVPKKNNVAASAVAIYDNHGKLVKNLTKVNDTTWNLGDITGNKVQLTAKANGQYQGYFAWFRSPSGDYWMYDYKNERYFLKSNNDPFPPSRGEWTFGTAGNGIPTFGWKYGTNTSIVWSERRITAGSRLTDKFTSPSLPGIEFEMNQVAKVIVNESDLEYWKCPANCMQESKVHGVRNVVVNDSDKTNVVIDFEFQGTFDNSPPGGEVISDGKNGLVRAWFNGWNVTFHGEIYKYPEMKVYAAYSEVPKGSGQCENSIGSPSQGTSMNRNDMDPNATGIIRADSRDAEQFDVSKGIPTSESLFTNAFADNYLFKQDWIQMKGKVTYNCKAEVKYVREWTVPGPPICTKAGCVPGPPVHAGDSQNVTYSFSFTRDYSYWQIKNLEVYKINRADMLNYALPGGRVTMMPTGYTPPSLDSEHDSSVHSHVRPVDTPDISYSPPVLKGGLNRPPSIPDDTSRLKGMAESATPQSQVNNDTVIFNGATIMDGAEATKDGPTPTNIPQPTTIGRDVLYRPNHIISSQLMNKANTISSGTIYYDLLPNNVNGGANTNFPINSINPVTVHTPTVNYSNATDDAAHNQKTRPNLNRRAFILDRPFTIHIPTSGQHRNILGYGNRDYAKYIKEKQVRFEFDVYSADKSTFYPKNTWISIPVRDPATTFYLPVWVDEGDYTIHFRSYAENAPSDTLTQQDANFEVNNHIATDTVPVEVIGRMYDFRITDIVDMNWELAFRPQKKSKEHTGRYYWVGMRDIDGNPRGNQSRYTLPIRRGSHPNDGFKNVAVKPGYHFKFDLKTKGNMFGPNDSIRITPTFEFVSRDGKHRQDVDLYYHAPDRNFVRIGSSFDTIEREITLNERLRNLHPLQIEQTGRTYYQLHRHQLSQSEQVFMQQWLRQVDRPTKTGGFSHMKVPGELRLFRGPTQLPNGVNPYRAYAAEQQWYGEFGIPSKVYVVQKGFPLHRQFSFREDAPFFLKNGYIVVNFNMETIRAGRMNDPHLQYIYAPLTNQWRREGFVHSVTDPYGAMFQLKDGDMMFYDAAQSSRDDYRVGGTH